MRTKFLLIVLLIVFHAEINNAQSGLIGCYPLANNANDYSGNNYNGTAYNVTPTTSHLGVINGAYHFSGSSGSYISIPITGYAINAFTYSAWCRPTAIPPAVSGYCIISIGGTTADQLMIFDDDPPNGTIGFTGGSWNSSAHIDNCGQGFFPAINQWYHVVMTRNDTAMNLYLNDTLVCTVSYGNITAGYLGTLSGAIGSRLISSFQNFPGDIDDVRIFNRALSAAEIKHISGPCVATLPSANFISSDTTFCTEGSKCVDFTDLSTDNPTSWQWFFPGASPDTSTQQNPTNVCYSSAGTYIVTLIATNSVGSDTLTVSPMITFANPPTAPVLTIKGGDTIICSHACSYQWYINGAIIAGATDSFYVASQSGTYSAQISDCIGCNVLSNGVTFPLSVDELNNESQIKIFPNPLTSSSILQLTTQVTNAEVVIYDMVGKVLFRKKLTGDKIEIEKGGLESGVYFVRVVSDERYYVQKLVVE